MLQYARPGRNAVARLCISPLPKGSEMSPTLTLAFQTAALRWPHGFFSRYKVLKQKTNATCRRPIKRIINSNPNNQQRHSLEGKAYDEDKRQCALKDKTASIAFAGASLEGQAAAAEYKRRLGCRGQAPEKRSCDSSLHDSTRHPWMPLSCKARRGNPSLRR